MGKLKLDEDFKKKLSSMYDKNKSKTPNSTVKGTANIPKQKNINNKTYSNESYTHINNNQNKINSDKNEINFIKNNDCISSKVIYINLNFEKYYEFFILAIILGIGFELGSKIGVLLFY